MLREIESDELVFFRHAQRCEEARDRQADQRADDSDADGDDDPGELSEEETGVAENQPVPLRHVVDRREAEEPGGDAAPDAAEAVAAEGIQGIIDLQTFFDQRDAKIADRTGQRADDEACPDRHKSCARRDCHKPDDKPGGGADEGWLFVLDRVDRHPHEHGRGGSDRRGHKRVGSEAVGRQGAAGVETKPAKPEHRRAEHHERNVVYAVDHLRIAAALAEHDREHQRAHARGNVHDVAAGEIQRAQRRQRAAFAPDHVCQRIVDHQRPENDEEHQRLKAHAPDKRSSEQRRRYHGKHHLEAAVNEVRNIVRVWPSFHAHAVQPKPAQVADDAAVVTAEGQRVTNQTPHQGGDADDRHTAHHRIHHIFAPHQPAVEEGQPRRHKEHQRSTDDHKSSISTVHFLTFLSFVQRVTGCRAVRIQKDF